MMFDPTELDGVCTICGATDEDFLPPAQRRKRFARLGTYSKIVAGLQWNAAAIDLTPDAEAWPGLPQQRRERLTKLVSSFRVAEDAVSEHLTPFTKATDDTLVAWVFFLQRRDETRHSELFDRIAAEVVGIPGDTPDERRDAARENVPAALLELFEERLPAMAEGLAAGSARLDEGVGLYHMMLEGVVFAAGQRALINDLTEGSLPGMREGVRRVELDERWHVGFGLRCLSEERPSPEVIEELMDRAREAAEVWGDLVPAGTRKFVVDMCHRRLSAAGLLAARSVA
jgi:ribonucleoside-diphosphate reductase beta chain